MKKSLQDALENAHMLSIVHKEVTYLVYDKPRCLPRVHTKAFISNPVFALDLANAGYSVVAAYKNGEKIIG